MNFKNNEKDIQKLLRSGTRVTRSKDPKKNGQKRPTYHRGLYVISRGERDSTYKIGMAHGDGGLFTRLKSYKLCWPYENEFYVHYLVVCPTAKDAMKLERAVLKNKRSLKGIKKNPEAQGRASNEYRATASKAALKKVLLDAMDRNRDTWEALVVLGKTKWTVKEQDEKLLSGAERPSEKRGKKKGFDGKEIHTPKKGYFSKWDVDEAIRRSAVQQKTRTGRAKARRKKKS
jgi:hypothetical protein